MIYTGKSLSVSLLEDGFAELVFDAQGSVNKFDRQTVSELDEATQALLAKGDIKGLVVRSAKPAFIVGADITEFTGLFLWTMLKYYSGLPIRLKYSTASKTYLSLPLLLLMALR